MSDSTNFNELFSDISKGEIKNLYLFYGQEAYLYNEAILRIEKKVINPAFKSLNYIQIDGKNLDFETIMNACETLPFMDERKIVLIREYDVFSNKKAGNQSENNKDIDELINYIPNIPKSTILIFVTSEDIDKRKKIYSTIKKNGFVLEFKQLKSYELVKWVIKIFSSRNKKISNNDAEYLISRTTGNMQEIINEANKICAYSGDEPNINKNHINAVVPKNLENNIFELIDALTSKNTVSALEIFNELLLDSEPIPVILTMITRQYRLLLNTKLLIDKGYSIQDITSKLGVIPFVASKLYKLSSNYYEEQIEDKMKQCLDADYAIKNGRMDQRLAIEYLIIKLAG